MTDNPPTPRAPAAAVSGGRFGLRGRAPNLALASSP
jgi:hypothetical protein